MASSSRFTGGSGRGRPRSGARVVHVESGRTVARAAIAETSLRRMVGLLAHRRLERGHALVLRPCASIHTWFMRFTIDVLFVDRAGHVLRAVERMAPFRLTWARGAAAAIELPAGAIAESGLKAGEHVRIEQS